MKKWNLVIDVAKCFNCNGCALACHDEYSGNEFPGIAAGMPRRGSRWIDVLARERGRFPTVEVAYLPVTCNHCDEAPCLAAAKDGAVRKRADGIVIIDPQRAKGQRQLVDACPYGAVHWNDEEDLPQAWPFDAHLLDQGWTRTRGSQVCPIEAMQTLHVEDTEMRAIAARDGLQVLHPEYGTRPRVYYRNLDRYLKGFAAGTLAADIGGVRECVEGARVLLSRSGQAIGETRSDPYGDFRFHGLDENSGGWSIEVDDARFKRHAVEFAVTDSACLGTLVLHGA